MFIQKEWIEGDPGQPPPPPERKNIRNKEWKHMHIEDILSMPDKWEYPFFAIWDSVRRSPPLASSVRAMRERLTGAFLLSLALLSATGVPLHPSRHDRPGVRQEAARHHDARVVHEAGRRPPRLRVELWRRQPARPRMGHLPRLQDRAQDARPRGHCLPRARLPEAPHQLYLVRPASLFSLVA